MVSGAIVHRGPRSLRVDGEQLAKRAATLRARAASAAMVGCGEPVDGHSVRIVDPQSGKPCADERVGEIWGSGTQRCSWLLERPELTALAFDARLPNDERPYHGRPRQHG